MKTIFKSIALLAVAAGLAACNTAEFKTQAFVSFSGSKYKVREDAGSIKIPVNLVADGNFTTTISYEITSDGTAIEGTHYTMPNKTGVITISTDPAKCDSIVINPISMVGTLTNNKTICIKLSQVTEDNIVMGATAECKVTILDIDGPLFRMVGDWAGEIKDYYGKTNMAWTIEEVEEGESEDYPNANLKIATGAVISDSDGIKTHNDIYCFFDESKNELQIYPMQLFWEDVSFSDGSVLSFSMDLEATMDGDSENPVTLTYNDDTLTFNETFYIALWTKDADGKADECDGAYDLIYSGEILRKND